MLSQIEEVVWFVNDNGLPNAEGTLTTHKCPGNVYPCDPPKSIAEVCDSIDSSVLNVETCNEGDWKFPKKCRHDYCKYIYTSFIVLWSTLATWSASHYWDITVV